MFSRSFLFYILFSLLTNPITAQTGDVLPRRADTGISMSAPSEGRAWAEIISIRPGSAGEKLGLKKGDRIIELNGEKLTSQSAYAKAIQTLKGGTSMDVKWIRAHKTYQGSAMTEAALAESFSGVDVVQSSV